jgi:hypothetical protein
MTGECIFVRLVEKSETIDTRTPEFFDHPV